MNAPEVTHPVITFQINGQDVSAQEGHTILQTARENGIDIPSLCHLDGLKDIGACRMCVVEVKGTARLLPACTTPVREGMEIFTESETLRAYRKTLVELVLAEGNHVCSVCVMNGHCELQRLAQHLGVDHVSVPYRCPQRSVDASHPRFVFDGNRCVLCQRCVRVCDQIEGVHHWDIMGRGGNARLVSDMNAPWGESESCTSCGKCVRVCPTGALYEKVKSAEEEDKEREYLPFLAVREPS